MDIALLLMVWLSFAAWLLLHVSLAVAVWRQRGTLSALLGFLVAPLMPYFGVTVGAPKRSITWGILAVTYGLLLFFASR